MGLKIGKIFIFLLAGIAAAGVSGAEDSGADAAVDNFSYRTVTTREGLTFSVPEDMPIETRGGIQAPIPFDEYMYGKFQKMENRLKGIETQLNRIEEVLLEMRNEQGRTRALAD